MRFSLALLSELESVQFAAVSPARQYVLPAPKVVEVPPAFAQQLPTLSLSGVVRTRSAPLPLKVIIVLGNNDTTDKVLVR